MPRISAASSAFQAAYRARIRRKALQALGKNPAGLSVTCLAAIVRVSAHGLDHFIRGMPEVIKSHMDGCTWYQKRTPDSGYSSEEVPRK